VEGFCLQVTHDLIFYQKFSRIPSAKEKQDILQLSCLSLYFDFGQCLS
jgi:hypothetical protein